MQADMRQAAKISALVAAMPRAHSGFASAPAPGAGGLPGLEVSIWHSYRTFACNEP